VNIFQALFSDQTGLCRHWDFLETLWHPDARRPNRHGARIQADLRGVEE